MRFLILKKNLNLLANGIYISCTASPWIISYLPLQIYGVGAPFKGLFFEEQDQLMKETMELTFEH